MPKLVGFQTMVILDPYGITFNAVGVFGLDFQLLFKSGSSYLSQTRNPNPEYFSFFNQSLHKFAVSTVGLSFDCMKNEQFSEVK